MTQSVAVARSYARAAFEVAQEKRDTKAWRDDLQVMAETFADPGVAATFTNPRLDTSRRLGIALGLLPDGFDRDRANFVKLLVLARRTGYVVAIRDEFEDLVADAEGRTEMEIVVAQEVTPEARDRLGALLGRKLGRDVDLRVTVDPSIIGGVVVRRGDRVTDGSVRRRLSEMREELLAS